MNKRILLGFLTPSSNTVLEPVTCQIVSALPKAGFSCVAECHLDLQANFTFSEVSADQIRSMVYQVAAAKPQAITTFCTNLCAAPLVEELKQEIGIPIYDTISVVVWKSLILSGVDPTRVMTWGRLFRDRVIDEIALTSRRRGSPAC